LSARVVARSEALIAAPRPSWLLLLCRVVVGVAALCALLLALAFAFATEGQWWVELLRFVPYPAWLVPAVVALALSFALSWAWRGLAAATVVLVLTGVMGLSVGLGDAAQPPQPSERAVRLMTYNIKAYRAMDRDLGFWPIWDEITRNAPDIVVMQDAGSFHLSGALAQGLPSALRGYQAEVFGQYIIVSRFPLSGCQRGDIPYRGQAHTYFRCQVTIGSRSLSLVTAHLLSPREGLNATRHERLGGLDDWVENLADRQGQAHKLAADLGALPRPLIVAGDLNAAEQSPVVRALLAAGLRDAYRAGGLGWGYTIGHALKLHLSFARIDHILVSPEIGVQRTVTGGSGGSEHRPVIADLLVPQ
jgi:endonuclease/exonuclease/phosphatase (EEP) superfamily protein YafD